MNPSSINNNQIASKKKAAIKNPLFIKNSTFPLTEFEPEHANKFVNSIRHIKISKKILEKKGKEQEINQMVWEYHSDRAKNSVDSILKKFKGNGELHVIFSGDPKSYQIDNIIRSKKEAAKTESAEAAEDVKASLSNLA